MPEETIGTFKEIGTEFCQTLQEIMDRKNDAEVRPRRDGTYDLFELEKKRRKPRVKKETK